MCVNLFEKEEENTYVVNTPSNDPYIQCLQKSENGPAINDDDDSDCDCDCDDDDENNIISSIS